jgi:hypothetical protein
MLHKAAGLTVIALLTGGATAYAASGLLTDPKGDYPDIVKLAYANAKSKVTVTLTYAGARPQNESLYVRWGSKGQSYQVFLSESAGLEELRYYRSKTAASKTIACKGLVVRHATSLSTTAVIPRTCLAKAPDTLRFQGIATEGIGSADETKVSKGVRRG